MSAFPAGRDVVRSNDGAGHDAIIVSLASRIEIAAGREEMR
jgi:hypothetical protein